jgi:hypothetical protein
VFLPVLLQVAAVFVAVVFSVVVFVIAVFGPVVFVFAVVLAVVVFEMVFVGLVFEMVLVGLVAVGFVGFVVCSGLECFLMVFDCCFRLGILCKVSGTGHTPGSDHSWNGLLP